MASHENPVSIILSTDWDPYAIIKQFIDNVIYQSVKVEINSTKQPEAFDSLFNERCEAHDKQNEERRFSQATAILDSKLFESCQPADVFVWHYPTELFLSFSFPEIFKKWMSSVSISKLISGT